MASASPKSTAPKKAPAKKQASAAPKKAPAKKAAPKKTATASKATPKIKRAAPKRAAPRPEAPPVAPVTDFLDRAAGLFDATVAALPGLAAEAEKQARAAASVATETAKIVGEQAQAQANEFAQQANEQFEKGKEFVRQHPGGVVLSALGAATVAGLAAGRATFNLVRRARR